MSIISTNNTNFAPNFGISPDCSLYVGDLHKDVNEEQIFEMFNQIGPVSSIRVCRDAVSRASLGYAYVNFHGSDHANQALNALQGKKLLDKSCRISWQQRDPSMRRNGVGNLYIKNLPQSMDQMALLDKFSEFGDIVSCKVITKPDGSSQGYGYVNYGSTEAANSAITSMHGATIDEKVISVETFLPKNQRAKAAVLLWSNILVKLSNFPEDLDEVRATQLFSAFGSVSSLYIPRNPDLKPKGVLFVDFYDFGNQDAAHASALAAIAALNDKSEESGYKLLDVVDCQQYLSKGKRQEQKESASQVLNCYVKNITASMTNEQFRTIFSQFGPIVRSEIMLDQLGVSRGFGFVSYESAECASRAIAEMNGRPVHDKTLFVGLYEKGDQRRLRLAANFRRTGHQFGYPLVPRPFYQQQQQQQQQRFNPMYPYGLAMQQHRHQPRLGHGFNYGPMGGYAMPQYSNQFQLLHPMPVAAPVQQHRRLQQQQQQQQQHPNNFANNSGRVGGGRGGRGARYGVRQQQQNTAQVPQMGAVVAAAVEPVVQFKVNVLNAVPDRIAAIRSLQLQPIDHTLLASLSPQEQKNMFGERLYPMIKAQGFMEEAGKVTGMLLEMDNSELMLLLQSPEDLIAKTDEALAVLEHHFRTK